MAKRGAPAQSLVGATFAGKYRVVQYLRSGGIAHVYLAERLTLRPAPPRDVAPVTPRGPELSRAGRAERLALKVLRDEMQGQSGMIRRFERGAVAAARIAHPNVVRVGGLERLPSGVPFCTMELLIGLDLADTLEYAGRLEPLRALRIAEGAAAGLAAAHAAGVVHLDVKPENLFLVHQADGREGVKLLDFGLSAGPGDPAGANRVEAAGSTPEYMPPEQERGAVPSPAMDVYALGVVLHEMLLGQPPGGVRESGPSLPVAAMEGLPARISEVLVRALSREPSERFGTMEEMRVALVAAAEADLRSLAGPASSGRRSLAK